MSKTSPKTPSSSTPTAPTLTEADYAEIEKRVLAHMAQRFPDGEDVTPEELLTGYSEIVAGAVLGKIVEAELPGVIAKLNQNGTITGRLANLGPEAQEVKIVSEDPKG